jgi:hypothetical protein
MSNDGDAENDIDRRLRLDLKGFQPAERDDPGFAMAFGRPQYKFPLDPLRLPLPSIQRLALAILGCNNLGRGEKLAWEHTFQVDGVHCSLALQKFGLRLYVSREVGEETAAEALVETIVKRLLKAQRRLERELLRPYSVEQIRLGRVTLRNQHSGLRATYEYFRDGARLAYEGKGRLARDAPGGGFRLLPDRVEGWHNTVAMVTAYFSLLEHNLVLALPFIRFDPSTDSVTEFIGKRWGDKF